MKILIVNKFLYHRGGDATVALDTGNLLEQNGHEVQYWGMSHPLNTNFRFKDLFVKNIDFNKKNTVLENVKMSLSLLYSFEAKRKINKVLKLWKPDIVHLHNYAHQISPSILHSLKKQNIPIVMTMHEYKMVCASYLLLSDEKICDLCKDERYYNCFFQKCVKKSRLKSLLNTIEMYLHHKILHIYDSIDIYISPSKFLKEKVKEMGFKGKTVQLSNFIIVEDYIPKYEWDDNSIAYLGRLSKEKGLFTLIESVKGIEVKLKIFGEGLLREKLEAIVRKWNMQVAGIKNNVRREQLVKIEFLGYKNKEELKNEIRKCKFIIVPSEWYENNPRSIIEAFALGKPAIGARIGGIPELVLDKETGYTFELGNSLDLQGKIKKMLNQPNRIIEYGRNARLFIEREFNSQKHYKKLIKIYELAIAKHGRVK